MMIESFTSAVLHRSSRPEGSIFHHWGGRGGKKEGKKVKRTGTFFKCPRSLPRRKITPAPHTRRRIRMGRGGKEKEGRGKGKGRKKPGANPGS